MPQKACGSIEGRAHLGCRVEPGDEEGRKGGVVVAGWPPVGLVCVLKAESKALVAGLTLRGCGVSPLAC